MYLSYFSRFSQKITTPHEMPSSAQVRYYFDHNSGTTEPILMNFFLNTHNPSLLKKIHQNRFRFTRVIVMTDRRTDRRTERRTDRRTDRRTENFFFSFFAYLGLDRWSAPI